VSAASRYSQHSLISSNAAHVVRMKDRDLQMPFVKDADELGDLADVYRVLEILGSTPWKINKQVLAVVTQVWNSGQEFGKIPIKDPHVNIPAPEPPEDIDTNLTSRSIHKKRLQEVIVKRRSAHSERCHVNYKLEIAQAVRIFALRILKRFHQYVITSVC
jgi:DNA-directed RNA polymerase, mitochondrial